MCGRTYSIVLWGCYDIARLTNCFMLLLLSFDAVPQYFSFQAFQKAGLDFLQPDIPEVQQNPGIPSIAEAYHLDKKEVCLIFSWTSTHYLYLLKTFLQLTIRPVIGIWFSYGDVLARSTSGFSKTVVKFLGAEVCAAAAKYVEAICDCFSGFLLYAE